MKPKEIKELRLKLGLSQQAFSNLVGVAMSNVNKWENGVSKPSPLALNRLHEISKTVKDEK